MGLQNIYYTLTKYLKILHEFINYNVMILIRYTIFFIHPLITIYDQHTYTKFKVLMIGFQNVCEPGTFDLLTVFKLNVLFI